MSTSSPISNPPEDEEVMLVRNRVTDMSNEGRAHRNAGRQNYMEEAHQKLLAASINGSEEEALFQAAATGTVQELRQLLKIPSMLKTALMIRERPYHDTVRSLSNTYCMLEKATQAGSLYVATFMLYFAAEHQISFDSLITVDMAWEAIKSENTRILEKFLEIRPEIAKSRFGMSMGVTLLGNALASGINKGLSTIKTGIPKYNNLYTPAMKLLLQHGADPNDVEGQKLAPGSRGNILSLAAYQGSLKQVELLLKYGATIEGTYAVHFAAQTGRLDVLETLFQHGANISDYCMLPKPNYGRYEEMETPLHIAVRYGQVEAVQWLLEHGADIAAEDAEGRNALVLAVGRNDAEMVSLLEGMSSYHWIS